MLRESLKLNFTKCNLINIQKGANVAIVWMFHQNFSSHAFMSTLDLSNVELGNSFGNIHPILFMVLVLRESFQMHSSSGRVGGLRGVRKETIFSLIVFCAWHNPPLKMD